MKKSRFTESQIVGVLKQVDAGAKVEDVCREHGISSDFAYPIWRHKELALFALVYLWIDDYTKTVMAAQ